VGHLVQQSVAARLEVLERLPGFAPAVVCVFVVALGVESVFRYAGGEEQRADLYFAVGTVV